MGLFSGGLSLVTGLLGAQNATKTANQARDAQVNANNQAIGTYQNTLNSINQSLSPYTSQGSAATTMEGNALGLNGADAQQKAYDSIQSQPGFQTQLKLGQNAVLQNASATGGLRGGNVQQSLANFAPQLLQQYLGNMMSGWQGLSSQGLNATDTGANAAMQTGVNVGNAQASNGAAIAGGALARGKAAQGAINAIGNAGQAAALAL